ncbi:MAG: HAMP domain-containing histidine kinase [Clostridiales bacterium]|nr:HAMP domain-containing histidine kinase [Clostridiales bacterium]
MKSEKYAEKSAIPQKIKSLNVAMWGYFCLNAILVILIVVVGFYAIVGITLENNARDRVTRAGRDMAAALKTGVSSDLTDEILNYRGEGVNFYIFRTDGKNLQPADFGGVYDELFKEIENRLGDKEVGKDKFFRTGNKINYALVAENKNGEIRYILASYSMSIVRETVGTLQLWLLFAGGIAMLLALLFSYEFSKHLTRGLNVMSEKAVKLAHGDYEVEFINANYKEMAQLSDSLNYVRDEVKKSEDFQREILANTTHDLKTPLTMIKAYASMIMEISGDNPEKRNKHLQVIIDESDRLTGLVNDVLSVSKLRSNMEEMNLTVFDLTELVYAIVEKFGYLQESQGYTFMIDIQPNLYTYADEEKIYQVLYNLIGNAANYTGADKTVYISLKSNFDGTINEFFVRDTGKGISEEELPEIWNRYYRVKENHPRPVKGTGLGLNIVKAILENHSFVFGVDSEVGNGSEFWVYFPAVPPEVYNEINNSENK